MNNSKYSAEFKEQILAMVAAGREPKEIAHEYNISTKTISNWRRYSKDPKVAFMPKKTAEQAELKAVKAELRQKQMELDILKKAMVIISKQ